MEALQNISLFQNLIYVSYALMALGLGLAIFFFFYFKIPDVFMMMTGRAKKETVQRIAEENFKTGKLRMGPVTGPTKRSGNLKSGGLKCHTGSIAAVHISSDTGPVTEPQADNTTILAEQTPETDVLSQGSETTVLSEQIQETSVLSHGGFETAPLNHSVPGNEVLTAEEELPASYGETSILSQTAPQIRFEITENTLVIHTDEKVG